MTKNILLTIVCMLTIPSPVLASDDDISRLFSNAGVEGALLIESVDKRIVYLHDYSPGDQAYIPASTFKIPNTLIALEEGVIVDQFETIRWDGVKRSYDPWNGDQTLATAFRHSCVWCYQYLARQIGDDTYKRYLEKFQYGNQKTGEDVITFWLDGDLRISITQQIEFLRNMVFERLPVKKRSIEILKDIMLIDSVPGYKLWGKTGWQAPHGWFVGYVESDDKVWFFANYIVVKNKSDLKLRKTLVIESMKLKGII
jgi:beta-lactamase class D